MKFDNKSPDWNAPGTEPPQSLKENGFQPGYKPPAAYFNYFWSRVSKCIAEIQNKLSNVDNTADAEKSVKHATSADSANTATTATKIGSETVGSGTKPVFVQAGTVTACNGSVGSSTNPVYLNGGTITACSGVAANTAATADKTKASIVVKLNGGTSEGTNQFTFNGSTAKTVNVTPAAIGLNKVNNTSDAEKSVKHASTASTADKTKASIIMRLNGGTLENNTQFTFDGSGAKTVNITASKIGAAAASHTHNYAGSSSSGGAANSALTSNNVGGFTFQASTSDLVAGSSSLANNKIYFVYE